MIGTMSDKEQKIQEAIRLVQDCNFSRRKAASSTGISPNTLKRRLNGSIPREEYLERTKKITASEELILENMIIALIQQNEHIKASSLRSMVALYIQNKSYPTKLDGSKLSTSSADLELIPKGWCTRFMKRSKNLTVSQGYIRIKDSSELDEKKDVPENFKVFMKPSSEDNDESIEDTQREIVANATSLVEGYRIDFQNMIKSCLETAGDNPDLANSLDGLSTIFNHLILLTTVLNFTSQVKQSVIEPETKSMPSHVQQNKPVSSKSVERPTRIFLGDAANMPMATSGMASNNSYTLGPELYNSATPITPPSPVTPLSPTKTSSKRNAYFIDMENPTAMPTKRHRSDQHNARSVSWSVNDFNYYLNTDNMIPGTTTPFTSMVASVAGSGQQTQQQQAVVSNGAASGITVPATAAPNMVEGTVIAPEPQQTDFFSQQVPLAQPVTTSSDFDSLLMSATTAAMTPLFTATASAQANSMSEHPSSTSFAMPFEEAIASAVTTEYVIPHTTTGPVLAPQFCYQ